MWVLQDGILMVDSSHSICLLPLPHGFYTPELWHTVPLNENVEYIHLRRKTSGEDCGWSVIN